MNRANFFNDMRVTDSDLNYIESSKAEAMQQLTALLAAKFTHNYSGSIASAFQQVVTDAGLALETFRGVGGGLGSSHMTPITGSASQISVSRGWGLTDAMNLIILTGSVTVNLADNTFNKSWISTANSTMYVYAEYQTSSSSVGADNAGVTYYKRYAGDFKLTVSALLPSGSNSLPLAQFTADGSGLITGGTFVDKREYARAWAVDSSVGLTTETWSGQTTLADHINAVGTGVPASNNPHGLSIVDLGYVDTTPVHRIAEHGNGIILAVRTQQAYNSFSGSVVNPTSAAYLSFTPPFAATASINGSYVTGSLATLSASTVPSDGTYWAVVNQNGVPSFISTASISFSAANPLQHPQYLVLGQAEIGDAGDDITSYTDSRVFYTMSQVLVRGDLVESTQDPATSLTLQSTLQDNLDRIRYQLGVALTGTGSMWNAGAPVPVPQIIWSAGPLASGSTDIALFSETLVGYNNFPDPLLWGAAFNIKELKAIVPIIRPTGYTGLTARYAIQVGGALTPGTSGFIYTSLRRRVASTDYAIPAASPYEILAVATGSYTDAGITDIGTRLVQSTLSITGMETGFSNNYVYSVWVEHNETVVSAIVESAQLIIT